MNPSPNPRPAAPVSGGIAPLVTDEVVDDQLQALASVDISEHGEIYEQLLSGLQHDLNQTGRGGQ
ncbi:hypothetical protein OK351_15780 [Glutamicibacter sp. MNS18]|uniref:hypothetical protein n=1 Tax=Glutamicibacter sp. MNS18 TaxID=2989817 RepID=UPI0022364D8D|nr:hypothetical protein [Glutamicibacter sp. MNS18]MCW4466946.1 hypothetical protein [Glutamicibacter sp. MNS18]